MTNTCKLPLYGEEAQEYRILTDVFAYSHMRMPSFSELSCFVENNPNCTWRNYPVSVESIPFVNVMPINIGRSILKMLRKMNSLTVKTKREINFLVNGLICNNEAYFTDGFKFSMGEHTHCWTTREMIDDVEKHLRYCLNGIIMHGHTHPSTITSNPECASLGDLSAMISWCVKYSQYVNWDPRLMSRKNVVISNIVANGKNHFFWYNVETMRFERLVAKYEKTKLWKNHMRQSGYYQKNTQQ